MVKYRNFTDLAFTFHWSSLQFDLSCLELKTLHKYLPVKQIVNNSVGIQCTEITFINILPHFKLKINIKFLSLKWKIMN